MYTFKCSMLIIFYSETAVLFWKDRQINQCMGLLVWDRFDGNTEYLFFLAMNGIWWHIYLGSQYPREWQVMTKKFKIKTLFKKVYFFFSFSISWLWRTKLKLSPHLNVVQLACIPETIMIHCINLTYLANRLLNLICFYVWFSKDKTMSLIQHEHNTWWRKCTVVFKILVCIPFPRTLDNKLQHWYW